MVKNETRQANYPEIVLGKSIRPFTPDDVNFFLKRREENPDATMVKYYNLDKFPIIIFIEDLGRIYEGDIHSYGLSPFGNITITKTINPTGIKRKVEGFAAAIVDNFAFERPAQAYSVIVEFNGKKIEGTKSSYSGYRFRFREGGGTNGFLLPEESDLSKLEYTFTKKEV